MTNLYDIRVKYENYVRLTCTRSTAERYGDILENFFSRFKEKRFVEEFYRADVEDYRILRLREGIKASTLNVEVVVLSGFWKWMMDRLPDLPFNPASRIKKLREPERRPKAIAPEILEALFKAADSSPLDKALLILGLTTGMRAKEMAELDWSDIDFQNGLINLPAEKTKTQSSRVLPLRDDCATLLLSIRQTGSAKPLGTDSAKSLRCRWSRLLHRAGYRDMGLHSLRYTFATLLHRERVDARTVQSLLGHKSLKTTERYLVPSSVDSVREQLKNLPSAPVTIPR